MQVNQANTAIEVRDVVHAYGEDDDPQRVLALDHLSFTIAKGELICFIGPSGCGKSTMLNMIGGLVEPTDGEVRIAGTPVIGPRPREVAYMFQEGALFPWVSVLDNIILGMTFQGATSKAERRERALQALSDVHLSDFANHYPAQLSGGMKQRVALARALALRTDILLMDEPFGALDEQTRLILGEDLSGLLSATKKTIVFVTHSLGEAVFLADRVLVFSARPGRIKATLNVDEPHPRKPSFMTSAKYNDLRLQLYSLLHDEMRKAMDESEQRRTAAG